MRFHPAIVSISACFAALPAAISAGPAFDAGSDGSDGALSFAPSVTPVTIVFDPDDLGVDPDGDGIYHFTTITVPENVTVEFDTRLVHWQPQHWLATGDIVIDGTLDLDGHPGNPKLDPDDVQLPSLPGPGGYPGGAAGGTFQTQTTGFGPGGFGSGSHSNYGNIYLQPLTGGSGGGGGNINSGGGGAGGGAILLASSTSVTIDGGVFARGGASSGGGFGAGGGIRVVAPLVAGTGTLNTNSGNGSQSGRGRVRIESMTDDFDGTIVAHTYRRVVLIPETYSPPVSGIFPRLRVTSIDGMAVPSPPFGIFDMPDIELDEGAPIVFEIEAFNVPVGTTAKLYLFSENNFDEQFTSTPLAGTLANSTATVTTAVPQGFAQGFVYASW